MKKKNNISDYETMAAYVKSNVKLVNKQTKNKVKEKKKDNVEYTCPVCLETIVDASNGSLGEEAIFLWG